MSDNGPGSKTEASDKAAVQLAEEELECVVGGYIEKNRN